MKVLFPIFAFILAIVGVVSTLDWEEKTAELVRWVIGALLMITIVLFLTGCADVRTLYHTCRDGHCS